jgi:3-methylcrotonyl-CoA carboxylase alpha subunit
MFDRVLIANRGEIACRVIETCQSLGIETVAVYSDVDVEAKHVELADRAVHIGAAPPNESYLRGDILIKAALETGAQAIHPGYGFLSENPTFVEAVEAAGLTFIGPSAQAIRAMGLKDAAKAMMAEAGVPIVPGYHGDDQDPGHLEVEADAVGYPVLIKAVAGGGGKGMRRVDDPGGFVSALESAKSEALGAFGNDAVLIEKFIEKPRHIEVQVFGDGDRAVHLFERDCSLQRRHQKVIEEAPAPGMTDEMRVAMGAAAVRAAEAIGYKGAGTVEFIVDSSEGLRTDGFWFMEMNTRLQVEHPVTEMITGIDLVEWQLRVAAGEPLPVQQGELSISGHAFEARIYAEDVAAGFLPATGTLSHLSFPTWARADSGVRAGDTISPFYDPMIAKLIVHGPTRGLALSQLRAGLARSEIAGTVTNHAFLQKLAGHSAFVAGDVDTGLIDRNLEALCENPSPCTRTRALAALAALGLPRRGASGFHLWQPFAWTICLSDEAEPFEARITTLDATRFEVVLSESTHIVERRQDVWWIDDEKTGARTSLTSGTVTVFFGNAYSFDITDPLDRTSEAGPGADLILAPMPGLLRQVDVAAGQTVSKGQRLAILEAMKMEHGLAAERDGVVAEVVASEGSQVEAGAPLIRLEEEA